MAKKRQESTATKPATTRRTTTEREHDVERKRAQRKAASEIEIPACADRERRERLEANDVEWLRYYFGPGCGLANEDVFSYDFVPEQLDIIGAIGDAMRFGRDQSIAGSRGGGKTTIAERLGLKYVLQGACDYIVILAATGKMAEDIVEDLDGYITENERLLADYPEVCVPVRELEGAPQRANTQHARGIRHDNGQGYAGHRTAFSWCGRELVFPRVPGSPASGAIIATRGLDAAVRGLKKKGKRPKLAIVDDPDTEDTARSEEQARKLELRIDAAIGGLGGQKSPIGRVILTTLQSRTAVSFKLTDPKQKPTFRGRRYRWLVKPPERLDLWEEYMQLRIADLQRRDEAGVDLDTDCRRSHQFYLDRREQMDAGAVVGNPHRFDASILADGSQREVSSLQAYYNLVVKLGAEVVATEYDNDPPAETDNIDRVVLSAYHIQTNCLSGLDRFTVPDGTTLVTRAADVQKLGLHHVTIAWDENAAGAIIDYDFWPFVGTEGRAAKDCELLVLEGLWAWHAALQEQVLADATGKEWKVDLTLIDMGWKDEAWSGQPVQRFCAELGNRDWLPSKGIPSYRKPHDSKRMIVGDNWHVAWPNGLPICEMNSDAWKLKVHEGFLAERGASGALTVYNPPLVDGRPPRNAHLSYAKHVLAETYESRPAKGFKRPVIGWYHSGKPNHWFDATYAAICARSVRGLRSIPTPRPIAPKPVQPQPATATSRRESATNRQDATTQTMTRRRIDFRRRA